MKGTTIRLGFSGNTVYFFKKNGVAIIFSLILLSGFVCGVILSSAVNNPFYSLFQAVYRIFVDIRVSGGFLKVLLTSVLSSLSFVLIAFISGLSLSGIPIIAITAFLRGLLFGLTGGSLIASNSFKGFVFYISIVLVPAFLSSLALVLSCREACSFSAYLVKALSVGSKGGLLGDFRIYCFRFIVILAIVFAAAVADMLLSCFFAGMFGIL